MRDETKHAIPWVRPGARQFSSLVSRLSCYAACLSNSTVRSAALRGETSVIPAGRTSPRAGR